jgi:hypothetical protein
METSVTRGEYLSKHLDSSLYIVASGRNPPINFKDHKLTNMAHHRYNIDTDKVSGKLGLFVSLVPKG